MLGVNFFARLICFPYRLSSGLDMLNKAHFSLPLSLKTGLNDLKFSCPSYTFVHNSYRNKLMLQSLCLPIRAGRFQELPVTTSMLSGNLQNEISTFDPPSPPQYVNDVT